MILFISDDNRSTLLDDLHKTVRVANINSESVPDDFQALSVELVVLDAGVNPRRGLDVLKKLKKERPEVPVIFLTEVSEEWIAVEAFRLGARNYYRKPVSAQELIKDISTLCSFRRRGQGKRDVFYPNEERNYSRFLKRSIDLPLGISHALDYMERHYANEIKLETLAREACMSKYHFSHTFKEIIGISPMKYLSWVRMAHAKSLLKSNNISISAIALETGFSDVSSFDKQFRKSFGVTPSAFRKSLKLNQK